MRKIVSVILVLQILNASAKKIQHFRKICKKEKSYFLQISINLNLNPIKFRKLKAPTVSNPTILLYGAFNIIVPVFFLICPILVVSALSAGFTVHTSTVLVRLRYL
jgi:hypothetical protein